MEENQVRTIAKEVVAESRREEAKAKEQEGERTGLAEAIKGIGDTLDEQGKKLDDFCTRFPELCKTVDQIGERVAKVEGAVSKPPAEKGTEEWKGARKADLDHILFGDCPDCGPVRDEVLSAKGKRLADLEAKGGGDGGKAELETSPFPKAGFKYDYDRKIYVKKEG